MATYVKDLRNAWSTITTGKCYLPNCCSSNTNYPIEVSWKAQNQNCKSLTRKFAKQQVPAQKIYFAEMLNRQSETMKQWTEQVTGSKMACIPYG